MPEQPIFKFDLKRNKKMFDEKFEQLVENRRNGKVKTILENSSSSVDWSNLVSSDGTTLLHLAAKHNNIDLVNFLLESGCNVDIKNSLGETPLFTALLSNHLEAIKTLMNAKANIWTNNAERVLWLLITNEYILNEPTLIDFMRQYKSNIKDLESMTSVLVKVNCPLILVVYVSDACLTRTVLETPNYKISRAQGFAALAYAMQTSDLENLRILWQYDRLIQSKKYLLRRMVVWTNDPSLNWTCMKAAFEHLTDWIVFDHRFKFFIWLFLSIADKSLLEMLLQQCNIDVQIMQKYKLDVLPILFGNKELKIEDLIELTCKRQLNVDAKSVKGLSALHYAAKIGSYCNIQFLLELGADCNIKDDRGFTALCYATHDAKCVELLLQNGADLHITDNNEKTVIEKIHVLPKNLWQIMLVQLAIDHYRGVQIRQQTLEKMHTSTIANHYKNHLKEVLELMTREIHPSLTLFTIMTKKAKFMARYVQSQETISMILEQCSQRSMHPYYYSLLQLNLEKAYNIYRAERRLAKIISMRISNPITFDHLVIERICDFLSNKDMLIFA